jgi:Flp pilus assembly protein TadD
LLGLVAHQVGRNDLALEYISQSVRIYPHFAESHNNLGAALAAMGRFDEAIASYREAVRLKPDYTDAYNNLGIALGAQRKPAEAAASLQQAIRYRPHFVEAHNNLGIALAAQGKIDEAVAHYHEALRLNPQYAEAYNNLGVALKENGQVEEAIANYRQALRYKPDYAEAHSNLAAALAQKGDVAEAVKGLQQSIRLKPTNAEAHNNLGVALKEEGKLDLAIAEYREALRLNPDYAEAHNNLGVALAAQDRMDEALVSLRSAVILMSDYADAYNNIGMALKQKGMLPEALTNLRQAIALKPDYPEAHRNLAMALLLTGNLAAGWEEYEWRSRCEDSALPVFAQPLWDGSSLDGRKILLYAEQGLGDTLQFVRYAPLVQAHGGRVVVACPKPLVRIVATCPGVENVVDDASQCAFDVQSPLLSLPRIFGTSLAAVPADIPYLSADPSLVDRWKKELGGSSKRKVGIAWQGSTLHRNDRNRSFPLALFEPLAGIERVRLFSLQTGFGTEQLEALAGRLEVTDVGRRLDDFSETAAVIKYLDLVVTADTALAHLAGALGTKVWVALPFAPDWRWLLDRDDSPWYPTMRLFRQTERGGWKGVFERIAAALQKE